MALWRGRGHDVDGVGGTGSGEQGQVGTGSWRGWRHGGNGVVVGKGSGGTGSVGMGRSKLGYISGMLVSQLS